MFNYWEMHERKKKTQTNRTIFNSRGLLNHNKDIWRERWSFQSGASFRLMSFERTLVVALLPFCAMKSPMKKHDLCSKLQTSYTVSLQLGSQQLHSPPQFTLSLHPSLAQITTNQLMQTINKIPLTHTLAQARNCNQANNPLFTTQSFSSVIWGFDKGCSNKDWSYLREKDQQHIGWVTDTARARWSSSLACPLSTASVSVSNLFRVICRNKRWTLVLFFPLHEL